MKNFLILFLILLIPHFVQAAKSDTTVKYTDYYGEKTSKRKASRMVRTVRHTDGSFWMEKSKMDGKILLSGTYLSDKMEIKNGYFVEFDSYQGEFSRGYYENNYKVGVWETQPEWGKVTVKGSYTKGLKDGLWEYWESYGALIKRCNYSEDTLNGSYELWENKRKTESGSFLLGKEDGAWKGWHLNGELAYEGSFSNGSRSGEWTYYYENGNRSANHIYKGENEPQSTWWDEAGNEKEFDGIEFQDPVYPGGERAMFTFIRDNVQYPSKAREAGEQGMVYVEFVVQRSGKISDAKVIKGVSESIDKEAIRVVNKMPNWEPGISKGQTVRVRFTMPLSFRLG
ncbi:energy transducer TonB [Crocinitomix catalasitica]|uniref:energy transducer TonB n=1 Tax=Crocinitomix catalasitica TaxID=184607 RepID=UPI000686BC88|nr:energy transducer TonB [Crocinitomix catalasitica]